MNGSNVRLIKGLVLINLVLSCFLVGVAWMTQMSYWLWGFVGRAEFEAYHNAWWSLQGIIPMFTPLIVVVLITLAMLRLRPPRVPVQMVWLGIGLLGLLWVLSIFMWGQWQSELTQIRQPDGSIVPLYFTLFYSHWGRVALFTAFGLLQVWIAYRSLLKTDKK